MARPCQRDPKLGAQPGFGQSGRSPVLMTALMADGGCLDRAAHRPTDSGVTAVNSRSSKDTYPRLPASDPALRLRPSGRQNEYEKNTGTVP